MYFPFIQAKDFFKAIVRTKGCLCGDAVVLSLQKAVPFANMEMTPAAIRNYIETNKIGCTNKTMRTATSSRTCVHIRHASLPQHLLAIIKPESGITCSYKLLIEKNE